MAGMDWVVVEMMRVIEKVPEVIMKVIKALKGRRITHAERNAT